MLFGFLSFLLLCIWVLVAYRLVRHGAGGWWMLPAVGIRVVAGIAGAALYKYYYGYGDILEAFRMADAFGQWFLRAPLEALRYSRESGVLPPDLFPPHIPRDLSPRALFYYQCLSPLVLCGGGNYWLSTAWLSALSGLASWHLVQTLTRLFPSRKKVWIFSFLLLPSFVFWTSGLFKESLAWVCIALSLSSFLSLLHLYRSTTLPARLAHILVCLLCWWLLLKLKFYFAAVLLPALLMYAAMLCMPGQKPFLKVAFGVLVLAVAVWFVSFSNTYLRLTQLGDMLVLNYSLMAQNTSPENLLEYYHYSAAPADVLRQIPRAGLYAFAWPLPGGSNILVWLAGSETLVLWLLIISGFRMRLISLTKPALFMIYVLVVYIFAEGIFLALATANIGTLLRYRIAYWPFMAALLLAANCFLVEKSDETARPVPPKLPEN